MKTPFLACRSRPVTGPGTIDGFLKPFRADSPWNLPIASSAVFADEPAIRAGGGIVNSETWSDRIHHARSTDPIVTCAGGNLGTFTLRVGKGITSSNGMDGDLTVIGPDGHTAWDFYKFIRTSETTATYVTCRNGALTDVVGGTGWGSGGTFAGVAAAGCAFFGGIIRTWELMNPGNDRIRHALQCSIHILQLKKATTKEGTWQWPAITADGSWATYSGSIKIGALFAIPPDVDINSLGLASPEALALAWTMQNFGIYVVNKGGSTFPTCIICCETETPAAPLARLRAGWPTIVNQLRLVTNSAQATPAGKTSSGIYPPALYPAPTPIPYPL